jgi:hypothetical protein
MRPQDLFADAIPSAPEAEVGDLDVPIDLAPLPGVKSGDDDRSSDEDDESDDEEEGAADEGGGVALPLEDESAEEETPDRSEDANGDDARHTTETERVDIPEPSYDSPSSGGEIAIPGSDDGLISMDELFSSSKKASAAATEAPARAEASEPLDFGAGGVLPAPFLKPAGAAEVSRATDSARDPFASDERPALQATAPAAAPAAPAAGPGGPIPFALIPMEGIPDARFDLPGGGVYLLGRDKDAHVKILSTSVSRRHARIDATGTDHVLIDLGSANGTQVNGTSVARQALKEGDLIRMGKVILRYTGPAASG